MTEIPQKYIDIPSLPHHFLGAAAVHDLTLQETQDQQTAQAISSNAIVLSNVVELATSVVRQMAKQDLAQSLGDQSQTREVLTNIVANRVKQKLAL